MGDVPVRELRNDTAGVIERVRAGEDVTITVRGTAVAALRPVRRTRRWVPREEFARLIEQRSADSGLRDDLRALAGETNADDGLTT